MREESSVIEPSADGQLVASVKGSYSYPGPDGRIIRVNYVADQGGFRASGDHLPSSLTDTVYNFKYVVP
ncbi:unnamed protein product [Nezara viridula]|uniref:Uncharacterized protein n=1 Tax=Nezara viridula TaxID=85310 RepID=A0A9P0H1J9_NEZVI|nr:unnamed protein product [Nezara viridula]